MVLSSLRVFSFVREPTLIFGCLFVLLFLFFIYGETIFMRIILNFGSVRQPKGLEIRPTDEHKFDSQLSDQMHEFLTINLPLFEADDADFSFLQLQILGFAGPFLCTFHFFCCP
jgi:hypothetical protein